MVFVHVLDNIRLFIVERQSSLPKNLSPFDQWIFSEPGYQMSRLDLEPRQNAKSPNPA